MKGSERTYRVVLRQVICGFLLGHAADLSDQDDSLRLRVPKEHFQAVDEVGSVERIATDADAQSLSQSNFSRLMDGFVRQGAGT